MRKRHALLLLTAGILCLIGAAWFLQTHPRLLMSPQKALQHWADNDTNYRQVTIGMARDEVRKLMGEPTQIRNLQVSSRLAWVPTTTTDEEEWSYSSPAKDGGKVIIGFDNRGVIYKGVGYG